MIKEATLEEILKMTKSEGLVVDCTKDQIDTIISAMYDEKIIKSLNIFNTIYVFKYKSKNNDFNRALFLFDDIDFKSLNIPKLAVWRLTTKDFLNGIWLSDFINMPEY